MLKVKNINTYYGKVHALKNISLHLSAGEIVALIGANGAGKTTMLNTLSGVTPPASGSVQFQGEAVAGLAPDRIVKIGISQVPEGRQVFKGLTVADNLELGAYLRFRGRESKESIRRDMGHIYELFPRLEERRKQMAGTLSGGEQQMLAIGRALAGRPDLMLLDEPSEGLAPLIVDSIGQLITRLRDEGMTFLLAEQNLPFALSVASRGYVLEKGRIVDAGDVTVLQSHKVVRDYLMV